MNSTSLIIHLEWSNGLLHFSRRLLWILLSGFVFLITFQIRILWVLSYLCFISHFHPILWFFFHCFSQISSQANSLVFEVIQFPMCFFLSYFFRLQTLFQLLRTGLSITHYQNRACQSKLFYRNWALQVQLFFY